MRHDNSMKLEFGPGFITGSINEHTVDIRDESRRHLYHKPYASDFGKPLPPRVKIDNSDKSR